MPQILLQIAVVAAIVLLVWLLADVVLLVFLGVLFACILHGMATWFAARTGQSRGLMLAVVSIAALLAIAGAAYWIAPKLIHEGRDLVTRVTQEWRALQQDLGQNASGAASGGGMQTVRGMAGKLASPVETVLGSTLTVIADIVIVIITALYLAASPDLYVRGVLHLVPVGRRARANEVMTRIGHVLRLWCLGQLVDMITVGVLAASGFLLVGVPEPWALGLLAGLLTFIPYFGAILAGVPAVLVALTINWTLALWALGICVLCHCVEGYVVAPLVQRRLVHLPPALTVVAMTISGTLFGVLGVALGTPLAAAALVAVQMLYVEDTLADHSIADQGRKRASEVP